MRPEISQTMKSTVIQFYLQGVYRNAIASRTGISQGAVIHHKEICKAYKALQFEFIILLISLIKSSFLMGFRRNRSLSNPANPSFSLNFS